MVLVQPRDQQEMGSMNIHEEEPRILSESCVICGGPDSSDTKNSTGY
jgi:hypothetical protein